MLMMEAYFRVLLATLDALYTNLSVEGSCATALYPSFGHLYPEDVRELQKAWRIPQCGQHSSRMASTWPSSTR